MVICELCGTSDTGILRASGEHVIHKDPNVCVANMALETV